MPDTFSAKQVATRIGTDAKTLRKFLRSKESPYEAVGQGGRYEFPAEDLARIKKSFVAWQKEKRPTTVTPEQIAAAKKPKIKVTVNDGPEFVMEADDEPSQAELDQIEDELKAHFPDEDFELEID